MLNDYLKAKTLVLTGFTTDICVPFTASDAYMRDSHIIVPTDCVAAASTDHHDRALEHMSRVLDVSTVDSSELDFSELIEARVGQHPE